ncbi:uncharacterized protein METZ01_LOCUS491353, partial [marine metagenome]
VLNKTCELITGTVLSLFAAVLLLLFSSTQAMAGTALLGTATTAWTVTAADTLDASIESGAPGNIVKPLIFDQSGCGATTLSLTVTGVGAGLVGTVVVTGDNNASDVATLAVGDGTEATAMVISLGVTGNAANDTVASAADLNITVGLTAACANGIATLTFKGDVDAQTGLTLQGDD